MNQDSNIKSQTLKGSPLIEAIKKLDLLTQQHEIALCVFERGAGLTQACGSGACAAFVAAKILGIIEANAKAVHQKGGVLEISWAGPLIPESSVAMRGSVEFVFEGKIYV